MMVVECLLYRGTCSTCCLTALLPCQKGEAVVTHPPFASLNQLPQILPSFEKKKNASYHFKFQERYLPGEGSRQLLALSSHCRGPPPHPEPPPCSFLSWSSSLCSFQQCPPCAKSFHVSVSPWSCTTLLLGGGCCYRCFSLPLCSRFLFPPSHALWILFT